MSQKFIAIRDGEQENTYIEDSPQAVAYALTNNIDIAYYPIVFRDTKDGPVPSLGKRVTLRNGPRTVVRRVEQVELVSGSDGIGNAEVEVADAAE